MKNIPNYIKEVSPCVYLEFTRGNISSGKFIRSVMSTTVGGENTQEEGAGLWKKLKYCMNARCTVCSFCSSAKIILLHASKFKNISVA